MFIFTSVRNQAQAEESTPARQASADDTCAVWQALIICTAAAKVIAFLTTTTGDPTAAAVDPSAAAGEPTAAAAVGASTAATGDRHRVGVEISLQLQEMDTV